MVEHVHNAVNISATQAVLVAIFDKAPAGVDHKNAFAAVGVLFINHNDARRDAGAVKQVGWQTNNAFDIALLD
ncbi:Uncharacterised protein [Klebsiella pneumoniae]|nr:Uncharacterised protein [Klebsiella pneumoniae]